MWELRCEYRVMDPKEDYDQKTPSEKPIEIDETGSSSSGTKSTVESFLDATRLSVTGHYLPKTNCDVETQPYFFLNDLWESFENWSAYGAGVPSVINGVDSVQYFVPSLSAIQIFEKPGEMTSDSKSRIEEDFTSDDGHAGNPQRVTLLQFFENASPYNRMPLADKIDVLAENDPDLKRLRSCDIHPASWFSVAWYPIYRIPAVLTLKDSIARFLTYHYLSTPITGNGQSQAVYSNEVDGIPKVSLPAFGMGFFKLDELISPQNSVSEYQIANPLMQEADKWLRHLSIAHDDAKFFGLGQQNTDHTGDDLNYQSNEPVPVSTIRPALNTGNDTV